MVSLSRLHTVFIWGPYVIELEILGTRRGSIDKEF